MTGSFGEYGGRYVPETLVPALDELEAAWSDAKSDEGFWAEVGELGRTYAGRPTSAQNPSSDFASLQAASSSSSAGTSVSGT